MEKSGGLLTEFAGALRYVLSESERRDRAAGGIQFIVATAAPLRFPIGIPVCRRDPTAAHSADITSRLDHGFYKRPGAQAFHTDGSPYFDAVTTWRNPFRG